MEHFWTTLEEELSHITFEEGDTLYIQDSDFGRAVPLQKFVQLLRSSSGGSSSTKCIMEEVLQSKKTYGQRTATLHFNSMEEVMTRILEFQDRVELFVVSEKDASEFAKDARSGLRSSHEDSTTAHIFCQELERGDVETAAYTLRKMLLEITSLKDEDFCVPIFVDFTVGEDEVKQQLLDGMSALCFEEENRYRFPRIMGLHLGSGFGKTHILLKSAELLECNKSVYITYNGGGDIANDKLYPAETVLLRVLLRLIGRTNADCTFFFCKYFEILPRLRATLPETGLFPLIASCLESGSRFHIAIDEVKLLCSENPKSIAAFGSMLGKLVTYLHSKKQITTIVLLSALTKRTLNTVSDLPIHNI